MDWVGKSAHVTAATRVGGVIAIHCALLFWALTSEIKFQTPPPTASITIELVELEPPPAAPEPEPEPEPQPEPPADIPAAAPLPQPEPPLREPDPSPPDISDNTASEHPPVLMQKERATLPDGVIPPPATTGSDVDAVTSGQIAGVLRQMECQKLTHRTSEDCPQTDPHTAWASNAARATVERNTDWDRSYRSKSTIDQFYEREVRGRLHWPDQDLFADPMPPGAYNADRIRRGEEPLWSKELRNGFRKPDD